MTTATVYRLSTDIKPEKYRLTLYPDLKLLNFRGEESISLYLNRAATQITLHAHELEVSGASVVLPGGERIQAERTAFDDEAETVTFTFPKTVPAGSATLNVSFKGILNKNLKGFYQSEYKAPDGTTKYLATTQFEATDARRAFPCWDDPAVKATFEVTLVVAQDLTAISNTPVVSETRRPNGTKEVRFAESPRMSTYLLVFIVGDMAFVEATGANGTVHRVWATRGKEESGRFALENSLKVLAYMNDYFGIPYPLPKLDHIAIPDFAAGAMENWGAITYRETALLFDPMNSAADTKQRIMEVVAHEMAHMWFGDLVTMAWWDDLWLNESFASWMGDKAVDHVFPEWNMWTQFVSNDTNAGLNLDSLRNSHPIEARVNNPSEIRELFDAISYSKGAATLRMLEAFLGEEAFRRGLRVYLSAHQYGNARTQDLWDALEGASQHPVRAIMDSWVKQMGYPLLDVREERRGTHLDLSLGQERFLYDRLLGMRDATGATWQIPVLAARATGPRPASLLMTQASAKIDLGTSTTAPADDWVKVNAGQTGFFRVNYTADGWERLGRAVAKRELPPTDRLGLQADAYALHRAGVQPVTVFLSLAEQYKDDPDVSVWRDLAGNLRGMETLLFDEPFYPKFEAFGRKLFQGIARRLGWEAKPGEGHLDALFRSTALGQAGSYGDPDVIREALARFPRFQQDPASVSPDLRGVVLGLVAQQGDQRTYDTLWDLERLAPSAEEKVRYLSALSRFRDGRLLKETLSRSLTDEVRFQDTVLVVGAVASTRLGRDLAWEFVKQNWAEFDKRYGSGGFAITRLVSLTGVFHTEEKARDVDAFFKTHPAPSATRTIQQALERIRLNTKWLEKNRRDAETWLSARA